MHRRGSGLLLHITSLPSPYGIGDLGPSAYAFADFLHRTGQSFWQVLPLAPTIPEDHSPYNGASAHCGLDVNMPAGTLLIAPLNLDDHALFHSLAAGFKNNRWRGTRRWPDGSDWHLQAHHLIAMTVPERTPLKAGVSYATTAGTAVGRHPHTHFMFRVLEQGGDYWLDPWILFWAMGQTARAAAPR